MNKKKTQLAKIEKAVAFFTIGKKNILFFIFIEVSLEIFCDSKEYLFEFKIQKNIIELRVSMDAVTLITLLASHFQCSPVFSYIHQRNDHNEGIPSGGIFLQLILSAFLANRY